MTPEEKFEKDVWYVLRELKKKSLYAKTGNPISYWVDFYLVDGTGEIPLGKEIQGVLEKLEEWGAIKIHSSGWEYV